MLIQIEVLGFHALQVPLLYHSETNQGEVNEQASLEAEVGHLEQLRGSQGLLTPTSLDKVGHRNCIKNGSWHCTRCGTSSKCRMLHLGDLNSRYHPLSECSGCGRFLHQEQQMREQTLDLSMALWSRTHLQPTMQAEPIKMRF